MDQPARRVATISASSMQYFAEMEKKVLDDEFAREMSFAPFSGAVLTDEERDKQLVRRLMRSLHNLYHHDHTVPAYGRAALGDGSYATQPGVNAREFRNWLVQYLPDPNNSIGRFVRSTPVLNKKGTKLTEKMLVHRLEDIYADAKPAIVRRHVEELCSHIIMHKEIDKLVELLKSEEAACTVARLEHVLIPSLAAAMRMANALDGHLTLATLVLEGCGLGSYTFEDLQNSRVKRIGSAGASRMNLATEPSRGSILADRGNGKLLEALATALSRCRALASLNLNSNAITDRDITSIARLSKLQTLGLGHNEISDSGAAMLGDALPLFNNLRVLDVSRNKIGDAGMTALCAGLTSGGKTPLKLQVLRVEYNRFRKEGWNAISAMLPTAAALTLLDVSGNTLTTLNDVANRFTGALQQCPSLSVLGVNSMRSDVALTHAERIEGGTFYDEAAEQKAVVIDISQTRIADALPAVLEPMLVRNHLTVLNVSNNLISPSGMKALCRALSFCQSVTTLNVAWNDIRDRGVLALIKVLRAPNCRITDLDVSYNQISGDATAKLVRTLQKNARATPTKRLNMAGNNFAAEHVPLLVKVLNSRTQPLTHLNLSDMNCRKLWKICMALSDRNRALQWLCLSKNGIHFFKVGNAEEFASRMLGSRSLSHLDLAFNSLGDDGGLAFARHLGSNRVLRHLDLSMNGLTKPSAYGLARALAHNRTLATLNLRWNFVGAQGAAALLDVMATNSVLVSLDAGGTDIPFRLVQKQNVRGQGVFHMIEDFEPDEPRAAGGDAELDKGFDLDDVPAPAPRSASVPSLPAQSEDAKAAEAAAAAAAAGGEHLMVNGDEEAEEKARAAAAVGASDALGVAALSAMPGAAPLNAEEANRLRADSMKDLFKRAYTDLALARNAEAAQRLDPVATGADMPLPADLTGLGSVEARAAAPGAAAAEASAAASGGAKDEADLLDDDEDDGGDAKKKSSARNLARQLVADIEAMSKTAALDRQAREAEAQRIARRQQRELEMAEAAEREKAREAALLASRPPAPSEPLA